jgi:hypothetical protein
MGPRTQGNDGQWVAMSKKKKKLTRRIPKNPILTSSVSPETRRVGATHHSKTATHLEIRSSHASHSELAVHAVICYAALDNTITAPFILHPTVHWDLFALFAHMCGLSTMAWLGTCTIRYVRLMCMVHWSSWHHLCGAWLGLLWVCGGVCSPPHTPQGFNHPVHMSNTWQPHTCHVTFSLILPMSLTSPWKHCIWQSHDFSWWIHHVKSVTITSYGVFWGLYTCINMVCMHVWT